MTAGSVSRIEGVATRKAKLLLADRKDHGIKTGGAEGVSQAEVRKLPLIAKLIYRALHLCGYGRMDLRMSKDGKVRQLEANATPDFPRRGIRRIERVG